MESIYFGLLIFIAVMFYGCVCILKIKNMRTVLQEIVGLEEEARKEKLARYRIPKLNIGILSKISSKAKKANLNFGELEVFAMEVLCAAIAFGILKFLFTSTYVALIGIPIGLYVPINILNAMISKRGELLAKQLHGCLIIWANSLRSGVSLAQAIAGSIGRVAPQINEELKRIKYDIDLGFSSADALEKALVRIPVAEFKMVVMTAKIHRQLGGNLAERFDNICLTIEERIATRDVLKAHTTQAKLGAVVAGLMPFIVLIILKTMSPDYLKPMLDSPYGTMMLMLSVFLVFLGWFTINKLSTIKFN
ncbi:type II secretion system protein [Desulfofarcimen acetoxidans DSM 771]|uniref:Type II secretion system protein n=1 Tax=Desulfofarcimen acetoxidans (strain ATCC 49208 / DSM 771 / KCTC 5769 / VKM B-1644 / 5575) TaxID=485916 RepID=C8W0N9_DESAS|nr:type II secretion system F family protein [Desulfofarcimen acetoxidans]ACV63294.1 type II secretion system protein [Desulfofarcimen acetoxidans DSM 771]